MERVFFFLFQLELMCNLLKLRNETGDEYQGHSRDCEISNDDDNKFVTEPGGVA